MKKKMGKVGFKLGKILMKSVVIAGLSKLVMVAIKKMNKEGKLQEKADQLIDEKAETAKAYAKVGVHRTIEFAEGSSEEKKDEVVKEVEKITS